MWLQVSQFMQQGKCDPVQRVHTCNISRRRHSQKMPENLSDDALSNPPPWTGSLDNLNYVREWNYCLPACYATSRGDKWHPRRVTTNPADFVGLECTWVTMIRLGYHPPTPSCGILCVYKCHSLCSKANATLCSVCTPAISVASAAPSKFQKTCQMVLCRT